MEDAVRGRPIAHAFYYSRLLDGVSIDAYFSVINDKDVERKMRERRVDRQLVSFCHKVRGVSP